MKRFASSLSILLCAVMVLSLAACGAQVASPAPSAPTLPKATKGGVPLPPESSADPSAEPEQGYEVLYGDILADMYALIAEGSEDFEADEGMMGIWEAISGKERRDALDSIGYAVKDVSGDGFPELLIGAVDGGGQVYAVYTQADGIPVLTLAGMSRSSYSYMGEGRFLYQGSNGAMYSIFGTYVISEDGSSLSCENFYFTYEKDESLAEIGFYHNTSGQWDKSISDELEISYEDFWEKCDELIKQVKDIDLIPFSSFETTGEGLTEPLVDAQWADDFSGNLSDYDEFTADDSDARVRVLFTAKAPSKSFKVYALTFNDVDEDGKINYQTQEIYFADTLMPQRPLVVEMTFYGDMPSYGISYVDETGATRLFSVNLSGEDGSLLLSEFW